MKQFILCLLSGLFFASAILAQSPDSLLHLAQKEAEKNHFIEAENIMKPLVTQYSTNSDYTIFYGALYSWMHKYDSSKVILRKVIAAEPQNADAYDALTNVEIWSKDYITAITDCDKALLIPKADKKAFLLKKAQAQYNVEDYAACVNTLDAIKKSDTANKTAYKLFTEAKIKLLKNSLQFGYLNNSFNAPGSAPWDYWWIEYMRNFYHCPVALKATYGQIYSLPVGFQSGWQYQLEAYPKITSTAYADASVAYSNTYSVFPQWQLATTIYQKLGYGFEGAIGGLYMHFIDIIDHPAIPPQDVWILDPYIGYYVGDKYQFSYKPYIAFKGTNQYITHTVTLRHFLGNPDTWVSIYGVAGTSPFVDYYFPSPVPTSIRLIGIDYQTRIVKNWLIWPMLSYEYEEYYPAANSWRNMYYVQVIATKRF